MENCKTRRNVCLVILALLLWFVFDLIIFEPRYPVLTTYEVDVPHLPTGLDGFRLVQLSDMHRGAIVSDSTIRRAVDIANSTKADVAVFTGDFVSSPASNAEPCLAMLSKLKTTLGSYAVLGNHDHWANTAEVKRAIARHRVTLLDNCSHRIAHGLYLVGIDDKWAGKPDVRSAFRHVPDKAACVMVSHTPLAIDLFRGKTGLLITGHTHGGQVDIPLIPRNRLPGLRGWRYIAGWYRDGNILMYVNRGIGMVNPPIRFRCRPEVTLYVLRPARDSQPNYRAVRLSLVMHSDVLPVTEKWGLK